jgi:LEA14-like dessication related protein
MMDKKKNEKRKLFRCCEKKAIMRAEILRTDKRMIKMNLYRKMEVIIHFLNINIEIRFRKTKAKAK